MPAVFFKLKIDLSLISSLFATALFVDKLFMNALEIRNESVHEGVLKRKALVEARRSERGYADDALYPLERFNALVKATFAEIGYPCSPTVEVVDRDRFKADFAIRAPELLRSPGKDVYMQTVAPGLVARLRENSELSDYVEDISLKGIYINVRISDGYFIRAASRVINDFAARFGETSQYLGKRVIVEYSDPNAAKKLHAGHIRSTIIGEVLSNIMDWNGATTYRWNHPNDLGGFGFLLEGFRRWKGLIPPNLPGNDQLAFIYHIRRTLERLEGEKKEPSLWTVDERELVTKCFGEVDSFEMFARLSGQYTTESNAAFERLENGDEREISLWSEMIEWSWADFAPLYQILGVEFDFTLGESFYGPRGIRLVKESLKNGGAVQFTKELAAIELEKLDQELKAERISSEQYESIKEGINNDIGAVVVMLPNFKRVVALRSDGRSIYTTRDLGMVQYRQEVFDPYRVVYEVGQEQKEHFEDLFAASRKLGLVGEDTPRLEHVYHGFYVDAQTKKKLSSRDGAASVTKLLEGTILHFERKYGESTEFSPDEVKVLAHRLGVGSIIINDIRKDVRGNFDIEAQDIEKTCRDFEDSGGAYLIYTACRTKSILRKYGKELPPLSEIGEVALEPLERKLIKRALELPGFVQAVGESLNPATLVNYLFELAQDFNSFYAQYPVLKGGEVHLHRLFIARLIGVVLENGLKVCDIQVPERI